MPNSRCTASRSASVVDGVIRSTMQLGKPPGVDPGGELGVGQPGEPDDGLAGVVTVALEVVAGQHGERGGAGVPAPAQPLDDIGEGGAGVLRVGEVVHDRRVVGVEVAGGGVLQVAALGDGEADDPHGRVVEPPVHGRRVVGTVEVLQHRADDTGLERAVRMAHHQGEQAVLGAHDVAHGGVLLEHADAADAPVQPLAALHQPVEVHRDVRAVEVAEAEVDDPDACRLPVVGRHGCRQGGQGSGRESGHRGRSFRVVAVTGLSPAIEPTSRTAPTPEPVARGKRIGAGPDCIDLWRHRPAAGRRLSVGRRPRRATGRRPHRSAASMLARDPEVDPGSPPRRAPAAVVRSGASTTSGRISRSAAA